MPVVAVTVVFVGTVVGFLVVVAGFVSTTTSSLGVRTLLSKWFRMTMRVPVPPTRVKTKPNRDLQTSMVLVVVVVAVVVVVVVVLLLHGAHG